MAEPRTSLVFAEPARELQVAALERARDAIDGMQAAAHFTSEEEIAALIGLSEEERNAHLDSLGIPRMTRAQLVLALHGSRSSAKAPFYLQANIEIVKASARLAGDAMKAGAARAQFVVPSAKKGEP